MYARYTTNIGATAADLIEDLKKILTGTTDVNLLSASCNKGQTEIFSTTPAGWEVHDAAAGTNAFVVKSPVYDNPAQFKYVKFDLNTAGYIYPQTFENWNATTHVGTNGQLSGGITSYGWRWSSTQTSTIFIYATARAVMFYTTYNATYGRSSDGLSYIVAEYSRWSPWDTTAAGYPNWFAPRVNGSGFGAGRYKNSLNADTGSDFNGGFSLYTPFGGIVGYVANASGARTIALTPVFVGNMGNGHCGGNITEVSNIFGCVSFTGNPGDEITLGGTTYIYFPANYGSPFQNGQNIAALVIKG